MAASVLCGPPQPILMFTIGLGYSNPEPFPFLGPNIQYLLHVRCFISLEPR